MSIFASCKYESSDDYVSVSGIMLDHETLELKAGEEATLKATVSPKNATDKTVLWKVDEQFISIISKSDDTLTVTVKVLPETQEEEVAKITATSKSNPNASEFCTVTIQPKKTQISTPVALEKINGFYTFEAFGKTKVFIEDGIVCDENSAEMCEVRFDEEGGVVITAKGKEVAFGKIDSEGNVEIELTVQGSKFTCTANIDPQEGFGENFTVDVEITGADGKQTTMQIPVEWQALCGEHSWDEGVVTKEPTDTAGGVRTFTCAICGAKKSEGIPMLAEHTHTITSEWAYDGIYHWHAASCGIKEHGEDKDRHTWGKPVQIEPPTLEKDGLGKQTCSICKGTRDYFYLKLCHTIAEEWSHDATHHWHAASCKNKEHDQDKAAHIWDKGVVIKPATVTEEGEKEVFCVKCGEKKTEIIPKRNRIWITTDDWATKHELEELSAILQSCAVTDITVKVSGGIASEDIAEIKAVLDANPTKNISLDFSSTTGLKQLPENAFYDCDNLVRVLIPDSVTEIGKAAFYDCFILESVTIPDGVTVIPDRAFSCCGNLKSVTIPDGVTEIAHDAFFWCDNLTSIEIPKTVTKIGVGAFSHCKKFVSVEIPDSVTEIASEAFFYCEQLESIKLSNGMTEIADSTFYHCKKLKSVTFPKNLTKIGSSAFSECSSLASVEIPSSVTEIGLAAFYYDTSLASVEIPNGVKKIGNAAFYKTKLTSIKIPDGVTKIGERAFYGTGLASIEIPSSVTKIGKYAFCGTSLSSIKLPEGLKEVGYAAFSSKGITSVTLPASLTSFDPDSFSELTEIKVASGSATYKTNDTNTMLFSKDGKKLILAVSTLSKVEIPNTVTEIGASVFADNKNITSVDIPDSVTIIGYYAFNNCEKLETVTIGSGIKELGSDRITYYGDVVWSSSFDFLDENLKTLTIKAASAPKINGEYAFPKTLATIYVPKGSVDAYKSADGWNLYADKIQAIPQ